MRSRVVVAAAVILIAVLSVGALHVATRNHGNERPPTGPHRHASRSPVPDVAGLDVQAAVQTLTAAGLATEPDQITVQVGGQPAGTVIGQNTRRNRPDLVFLTVSAGRYPHGKTLVVGSTCEFGRAAPASSLCVGGPVMIPISH
jgi:hypothetical protein